MTTPTPTPRKRSKTQMLGIGCLGLIGLCIVMSVLGSMLPDSAKAPTSTPAPIADKSPVPTNTPRPSPTPTVAPAGTNRSNPLPFGQAAQVGDLSIVVEKVRFDDGTEVSKGQQYISWKPDEGKVFLLIELLLKNTGTGDKTVSVSPIDFAVMGSANVVYGYTITGSSAINEPRGVMLPGGELRGTILYSVQKGETGLALQYQKFLEKTVYMDVMPR